MVMMMMMMMMMTVMKCLLESGARGHKTSSLGKVSISMN